MTGLAVPVSAQATPAVSCSSSGIAATPIHDPTFYVDLNRTRHLGSGYAGFTIASSTTRSNLWLSIDGTSGGKLAKAAGQPAAAPIGTAAPSAPGVVYVYLTASATTSSAQSVAYSLWSGQPGASGAAKVCSFSDTYNRIARSLQASSNKVTGVVVSNPTPNVGDTVTVTVTGRTGTIGAGPTYDVGVFNASLSKYDNWPADKLRLVATSLSVPTGAGANATTYANRLHLNNLRGANRNYTMTYTVHVDAALGAVRRVTPVQDIASGRNVKHTRLRRTGTATIGSGSTYTGDDDSDVVDDTGAGYQDTAADDSTDQSDDTSDQSATDDQNQNDDGSQAGNQDDNSDTENGSGTNHYALLDAGFGTGATCPATLNEDRSPAIAVDDVEHYSTATELYRSDFAHGIGGWEELSGHWIASNATLTQQDTCGFDYTALLTTHVVTDYTVEATFHADAANQGGIVFNQTSATTRSGASVVDLTSSGSAIRWGHYNNAGYYTYEGSQQITAVTAGQHVTIKATVHGTTATIYLDGTQIATMTNQNAAGYIGVLTNQSKVNFDSVTLTAIPA